MKKAFALLALCGLIEKGKVKKEELSMTDSLRKIDSLLHMVVLKRLDKTLN